MVLRTVVVLLAIIAGAFYWNLRGDVSTSVEVLLAAQDLGLMLMNPFVETDPAAIRSKTVMVDWFIQVGAARRQYEGGEASPRLLPLLLTHPSIHQLRSGRVCIGEPGRDDPDRRRCECERSSASVLPATSSSQWHSVTHHCMGHRWWW